MTTSGQVPVDFLVKAWDGDLWVAAVAMRQGATTARFEVASAADGEVEVVDEDRAVPLAGGRFSDAFAADYAVHIYRLAGAGAD